jgi:hypothetical protein
MCVMEGPTSAVLEGERVGGWSIDYRKEGVGVISDLWCWSHWSIAAATNIKTMSAIPPTIANPGYVSK